MGRPRSQPLGEVLLRVMQACRVDSLKDLADALGTTESTVRNWPKRNHVPEAWLDETVRRTGVRKVWLIHGELPIHEPNVHSGRKADSSDNAPRRRGNLELRQSAASTLFQTGSEGQRGIAASEPSPAMYSHAVGSGKTSAMLHAVSLLLREEVGVQWRDDALGQSKVGSPTKTIGRRPGVGDQALIPAPHEHTARPLVLSLQMGGDGKQLDYEMIPRFIGAAHAGAPETTPRGGATTLDRAGEMAFSFDWLSRNMSHTTGQLATIEVHGDSMSPTLIDGDTLVIDRGVREVGVDGIYVIIMLGTILVKRVQRRFDGTLIIMSDNPAYQAETVPRERVREIRVMGRMVCRIMR